MLKYCVASENDAEFLKKVSSSTPEGAEAYTFLFVNPSEAGERFFCGKNEDGLTECVVFNNGDENIRVFGDDDVPFLSFSPLCLMIYEGYEKKVSHAEEIQGRKILEVSKLLACGRELTFDEERRYVLRLRSVNCGYSCVFGIYEDGELVSCAVVSAENEKYALIADVFTRADRRKHGYAMQCVGACVNYALEKKKIPFLRCEEEMCEFYEKAGFSYYGKM